MKTLLQGKPWIPPEKTDVQQTLRQHGWKPRNEKPRHPRQNVDDYALTDSLDYLERLAGFKP